MNPFEVLTSVGHVPPSGPWHPGRKEHCPECRAERAVRDEIADAERAALIAHTDEQEALWGLLGDCLPSEPPAPIEEAA